MSREDELREKVELQARRIRKAEEDRSTVLAQVAQLGTLGLVFILPVVAGAYLGHWIDEGRPGYSVSGTLSLLILGLVIGATNVYFAIRRND